MSRKQRSTKTPEQRAAETVGVLERRLARVQATKARLTEELASTQAVQEAIERRLAYAKANPDLNGQAGLNEAVLVTAVYH